MPTKYAKERSERSSRRTPFIRQKAPWQLSRRARLNIVILVVCLMLFALQSVGPISQQRPDNRLLGAAVIEEKVRVEEDAEQITYKLRLRLLESSVNASLVSVVVSESAWQKLAIGDKVAVVYAPAAGLAPARILEIGEVPLEGAAVINE